MLCTSTAGKQTTGRKYTFHLQDKAIWKLKLLHQLPAAVGEEMVEDKAPRSAVLHVKYLKTSIIRMSDRTGFLLHLLCVLLLHININMHASCLKLKHQAALKAAHPLTPQRRQKSLKYQSFVHHISVNLISATMYVSAQVDIPSAPSHLSHVYQRMVQDTAPRYLRG